MPQVNKLGSGGLNFDVSPMLLPQNIFSNGSNIRFRNESVETITGEGLGRTLPIAANFGVHWRRPDQGYNIFGLNGYFYRVDASGNTSSMLSSNNSVYNNSDWQSTYFNGGFAVIINNGKSTPLYCLYNDINAGNSFQELPNWNYVAGLTVTAKVIRALNYSLVAANLSITENNITTHAPGTIRISVQASTGAIPNTWEPGVTSDTADEFELSSTAPILDMAELRGNMFVYSQDSISMLTIGNQTVVRPYSKTYGILSTDCVVEFDGQHFVVDTNDIYVHNGSGKIDSIADGRIKDYFFSNLNQEYINKVHVIKDRYYNEIWINYPKGSSTSCNEALIFNYKNNTWTKRELSNISYSFVGPNNISNSFQYARDVVYMTTETTTTLITNDSNQMYNGSSLVNINSFVEKRKLNTGDTKGSVLISAVYPVFDNVPVDTTINVSINGQNNYIDTPAYTANDVFVFEPSNGRSQGYKVDPRTSARVINFKIDSTGKWRLPLYDLDVKPLDRR